MDPISLIMGALAAGAASGLGDSATGAVKDAYAGLRDLVAEARRGASGGTDSVGGARDGTTGVAGTVIGGVDGSGCRH